MLDLISAGLKGVGMIMDKKNADANRQLQQETAANNIALQREFAQSGIQWKVEDAKAAGIHPLFALGANTHSFSPVSVGSLSDSNYASNLGSMGQDITRAINSTRTQEDRDTAFTKTLQGLQLEKATLENEALRTNIASGVQRLKQQANPPMPTPADIPEAKKFEDRPRLRMGGVDINTDPETANTEDAEKRYGDDGPASWAWGLGTMWNDYRNTSGAITPARIEDWVRRGLTWADRNVKVFGR